MRGCRPCHGWLRQSWIVWYAVVLHLIWGSLLLFTAEPLSTAPLATLAIVQHRWDAACILLVASGLALCSIFWLTHPVHRLAALIPQQIVMMLSALSASMLIVHQQYADGVVRPWAFMAADQAPGIIAAVMHTIALIEAFGPWPRGYSQS